MQLLETSKTFANHWYLPVFRRMCKLNLFLDQTCLGRFVVFTVLWHVNQLVSNDSINTFPHKCTGAIEWPLLGKGPVNTPPYNRGFCVVSASGYKEEVFGRTEWVVEKWRVEFRDASLPGYELGIELSRAFEIDSCRNGKKGIRRCKEDFMCELKWQ
jgi:hypothetical protein